MFNLFRKPKSHKHEFHVVAFDTGYFTTYSDSGSDSETESSKRHHLTFSKCACGKREMTESERTKRSRHSVAHSGITHAEHLWVIKDILSISGDANVYDDNYYMTAKNTDVNTWKYRPVTGVGEILKLLEDDSEFQVLCKEQPNVETAFGDFEAVVKLHENL
jgi:hypothetical protein